MCLLFFLSIGIGTRKRVPGEGAEAALSTVENRP